MDPVAAPTIPAGEVFAPRTFLIETIRSDARRAELRALGDLTDPSAGEILKAVSDAHLRAGRIFLRIDTGAVTRTSADFVLTLVKLHRTLLARRGTLIITGVSADLEEALIRDAGELLLVPLTAADLGVARPTAPHAL
jgi:anti-anti-sigma regulatory factor